MKRFLTIIISIIMLTLCFGTVGCNVCKNGQLYTLEQAYDNGWLSIEDLNNIAYYYKPSNYTGYSPKPKNPEKLSQQTELSIKNTYLKEITDDRSDNLVIFPTSFGVDNIQITAYYGTYNECVVVALTDDFIKRDLSFEDKIIGGFLFKDYCGWLLRVWRKV